MKKYILFIFVLLFSSTKSAWAQDPQFSQFYAVPVLLNPAFAGNTEKYRLTTNYRNQWPGISGAFISYSGNFDINFDRYNSGLGIGVLRDKAGRGGLRFTNFSTSYAYRVAISRRLSLRLGVSASYAIRSIDYSELTFGDQILRGGASTSLESFSRDRVNYFDMNTGAVAYSGDSWVGISVHHLTTPDYSLNDEGNLPMKYSVHAGTRIPVQKNTKGTILESVTLAAHYKAQEKFDQFDVGGYYKINPLVFGLWYRGIPGLKSYQDEYANHADLIFLLGYQENDFNVAYSYDFTLTELMPNTWGSHEISLVYEFGQVKRKRPTSTMLIPCAKF